MRGLDHWLATTPEDEADARRARQRRQGRYDPDADPGEDLSDPPREDEEE